MRESRPLLLGIKNNTQEKKCHSMSFEAFPHSRVLILIPVVFVGNSDSGGAPAVLDGDNNECREFRVYREFRYIHYSP